MTKRIRIENARIENADNSNHKVVVQVWQPQHGTMEDFLIDEVQLLNPTDLLEKTIWKDGQYLIIKEV